MRVEIGGEIIEFPDDMSEEEINAAAAKIYAQQQAERAQQQPEASPEQRQQMGAVGRFMQGLADPVVGSAQLLERMTPEAIRGPINRADRWLHENTQGFLGTPGGADQYARDREQWYRQQAPEGFDAARLAGNIVSGIPLAAKIPVGVSLGAKMGWSGLAGGLGGASMPVAGDDENKFWRDKATQAAIGAGAGTASPLISASAARVINPRAANNADLALLRSEGVVPTGPQAAGGTIKAIEEQLRSTPLLGHAINNRMGHALHQYNRAAINRSLAPIGKSIDDFGYKGIEQAQRHLDDAYAAARARLNGPVLVTNQMRDAIDTLRQEADTLTDTMRNKFLNELDKGVAKRMQAMSISPDDYKVIDSKLGQLARDFGGSQDPAQREAGELFFELRAALRDGLRSQNPEAADLFSAADMGYANLMVVEKATTQAVNNAGVFTPGQLNQAVRAADESVRRRTTARGGALMQDLATAGQNVLGNKLPDSGTAMRSMLGAGGLGYGIADPMGAMNMAAGFGGSGAVYLAMNPLLRAAVSRRPPGAGLLEDLVRQGGRMATPGVGMGAAGLLTE